MRALAAKIAMVAVLGGVALLVARPAPAEMADVYLKSGLRLRGDVTRVGNEVVVRNAAGELRLAADQVERIVRLEEPPPTDTAPSALPTQPATAPATRAPGPERPPGARVAEEPATAPVAPAELPAAPPISDLDITRLQLAELRLDGPPEDLRVRFPKKGKQRDLEREVLDELRRADRAPEVQQQAQEVLTRGSPAERLQLIVRHTGLTHADRIEVQPDPEVFEVFRRRVLPLVERGCARSGCHGGRSARLFRLPAGAHTSDTYAYTTFVLLDQMLTAHGPLIDRTNPEDSVLLNYLLPMEGNPRPHPPVGKGPAYRAVLRSPEDPLYGTVLGWVNLLKVPRPDYQLEYQNPYAGRLEPRPGGPAPADAPQEGAEPEPPEAFEMLGVRP